MADRKQKFHALNQAIDIAKKFARSNGNAYPSAIIKDAYKAIVEIIDEIEQTEQPKD